jgi:hypothetical protein
LSIYAADPRLRSDDEFVPGRLSHLVAGARGRLLDPRRTPVSVVEVRPSVGFVLVRIEGFEDVGARWEVPLEHVGHFQFEPDGKQASAREVASMEAAIRRFARDQAIVPSDEARLRTEARIAERQAEAAVWLSKRSRFVAEQRPLPDPAKRRGDPLLAADLEAYAREHGLWDMEEALTRQYVSNPGSGEIVKGHRIVIAELGLASYVGPIVRDPATFSGTWTHERRAEHVITRLAFLRALFGKLGIRRVTLWRGFATDTRRQRREGRTFVSTSFAAAVARSHYGDKGSLRGLMRRDVPVERLFMTYLETAAMNTTFLEAEAVLLEHHDERWP